MFEKGFIDKPWQEREIASKLKILYKAQARLYKILWYEKIWEDNNLNKDTKNDW